MAWKQEITLLDMAYVRGTVTGYGLFIQETLLYGKPSKKLTFLSDMSPEAFTPPPDQKRIYEKKKFTYIWFWKEKGLNWKKKNLIVKEKYCPPKMESFFFDVSPCGLGQFATDVLIIHAKAFLFETLDLKLC